MEPILLVRKVRVGECVREVGEVTDAEFEAGVQCWHESSSALDIWEFLGISREQYAERVTGKRSDPPRTELYTYDHNGNVLSVSVQPVPNWTGPK